MGRLKIAMFGAGRIGAYHFQNMLTNEQAAITHIVEMDTKRADDLVRTYNMEASVKVFHMDDTEKVLADESVEAVMVCTPHDSHEPIVLSALKAGKPVFCEKPFAKTVSAVLECYKAAEKCNLPLMCGFNRQFDPQNRRVWSSIQSGHIGKVRMVKITSRDGPNMIVKPYLQISGGIFLDACVHDIALSMWMVGEFPETVYATGHATGEMFQECGDIDTAAITLKFPSGAVAQTEMSRCSQGSYDQRCEVLGTNSVMMTLNKRPIDVIEYTMDRVHLEPIYDNCHRYMESYMNEVKHFVAVVKGEKECEIRCADVMVTTIIAHACKQSLDTQTVIQLKQYAKKIFDYDIPY